MQVYTYYHDVPQIAPNEQGKLIAHWQHSWKRNGWDPVILGIEHAKAHPKFAKFDATVRSFPSQNPTEYELACWYRWLALDQVGGGLMTDYDVMNVKLPPVRATAHVEILHPHAVPCAVLTQDVGAHEIVSLITRGLHYCSATHYSDMLWFQRQTFIRLAEVAEFGDPAEQNARLIHFSHHACGQRGDKVPRLELVRRRFPLQQHVRP